MNTEIINKQMDFNEAEIPFFPFYTNNIFTHLLCYIAFIVHWLEKQTTQNCFSNTPFYTPLHNDQLLSHQAICILFGNG